MKRPFLRKPLATLAAEGALLRACTETPLVVGFCDQQLRRLEAEGQFPKRIRLGPNRVVHDARELLDWYEARRAARDTDGDEAPAVEPAAPVARRGRGRRKQPQAEARVEV